MTIYYYPVLGHKSCSIEAPDCPDGDKSPSYVEFSVPGAITHADIDGTTLEWYQPVHEPGNVLSYPWDLSQIQQQFVNTPAPLTETPAPCRGTDTSSSSYTTSWQASSKESNSSGSTNSFSDDLSISVSAKGNYFAAHGEVDTTIDTKGSTSLSTLNENTASLSASTGITVNKPVFDSDVAQCCLYDFGGYIFGQKNANPSYQTINVTDPQGQTADIQNTGPLFVGFVADMVPNGGELSCGGQPDWWSAVYNQPDVAVNHPARWQWSKSLQTASFNKADRSGGVSPLDQGFYQMKGFFITQAGPGNGPSLSAATAGDQLSLAARVYNFSLVDTNSPSLPHPAASIRVRFYGQFFCYSGAPAENSCQSPAHQVCSTRTLCGNGFVIGDTQIASIPGFKSPTRQGDSPNWALATVPFDTTNYPNTYLVFWVVVWMEDASGNLVPEMPDHGLSANPETATLLQITDVPIEDYSNNVGMYGVNSPFFILPPKNTLQQAPPGSLQPLILVTDQNIPLDMPAKVTFHIQANHGALEGVNVAYFDGDPAKKGRLLDVQQISYMEPGGAYEPRTFFQPQSCGPHTLYAAAWTNDNPEILGTANTFVTIDPVEYVKTLISSTKAAEMGEGLRHRLMELLAFALGEFKEGKTRSGLHTLHGYIRALQEAEEPGGPRITSAQAKQLIAQAKVITGCLGEEAPQSESAGGLKVAAILQEAGK